jgi:hypothetical protein
MAELGIKAGVTVFDADGKRLGKVTRCLPGAFEVRRGLFSPYEWVIRYDEILELGQDSVKVARGDADLIELASGGLPHSWATIRPPVGDGAIPAAPAERFAFFGEGLPRSPGRDPRRGST